MKTLIARLRSFVIWLSLTLMGWNSHIHYADLDHDIGWRDHLRWWIEGWLGWLFAVAWNGSEEELLSVDYDEVPVADMSQRQKDYYHQQQIEGTREQLLLTWREPV